MLLSPAKIQSAIPNFLQSTWGSRKPCLCCVLTVEASCCKTHFQAANLPICAEMFLRIAPEMQIFAIIIQREACHKTAARILPRSQGLEAPAQHLVLLGGEWGPFLWSSRGEYPEEKVQSVWLLGRCVDTTELLRLTPLFDLDILCVVHKGQLEQFSEGCGFRGPRGL